MLDEQDTHPSNEPAIDWLGTTRLNTVTAYLCLPCWDQLDGTDEGVLVYYGYDGKTISWRMFL